jgi:hypothetical protein
MRRPVEVPAPAGDEDAPPPLVGGIHVVDLEGHHVAVQAGVDLAPAGRAHDHLVAGEHVVHRHHHRAGRGLEAETADGGPGEQAHALRSVEHLQPVAVQLHGACSTAAPGRCPAPD